MLPEEKNGENLAPRWHTAVLVGLIVAVALTGTLLTRGTTATPAVTEGANRLTDRLVAFYLPVLIVDWGLVFYVSRIGRKGNALPSLLGKLPRGGRQLALDALLALGGFVVIELGELAAAGFDLGGGDAAARSLGPVSVAERLVWVVFAFTAGFCEEVVYRGYLRRQLAAFVGGSSGSRGAAWGIALSALLFGIAHLDQGVAPALRFAGYAVGLGTLAWWRRSLVPGILCHVAVDLVSGLVR
jgi:membrane protease YdiL (CAAX protease family)